MCSKSFDVCVVSCMVVPIVFVNYGTGLDIFHVMPSPPPPSPKLNGCVPLRVPGPSDNCGSSLPVVVYYFVLWQERFDTIHEYHWIQYC